MTRYSAEPRDQIFVKRYGFMSFTKSMGKNTRKRQMEHIVMQLLDHAK